MHPSIDQAVEAAKRFKADWIKGWDDFMAKHPSLGMLMDVTAESAWERTGGSQASEMIMAHYIESLSAPGPAVDAEWCREFVLKCREQTCLDYERYRWDYSEDELTAELTAAIGGRGEWLPIETAPKDGTKILGDIPSDYGVEVVWYERGRWTCYRGDGIRPTQWTPIPLPTEPAK